MLNKEVLLNVLHRMPGASKLEADLLFNKRPYPGFYLPKFGNDEVLKRWIAAVAKGQMKTKQAKKILLFATKGYWINYSAAVGLVLKSLGHEVELVYLPENRKYDRIADFEYARYIAYGKKLLAPLEEAISLVCYQDLALNEVALPEVLTEGAKQVALWDAQYKLQFEDVDVTSELFQWRLAKNLEAAKRFLPYLEDNRPDVVVVPNGLILEYGMLKRVCDLLKIPTTTYEFGEQRERMWLSQDESIMLMRTDAMWERVKTEPFTKAQKDTIEKMYVARRGADVFEQFARRWQSQPMQDEGKLREALGLDERPIGLMATNVFGDSLTLGRDVFTGGIQGWLEGTLDYFAKQDGMQLIIRVHPGELLNPEGYSVGSAVKEYFQNAIPENIHLIEADDQTNTYSLINLASFGLTYTTTVGMELAMSGVPVIVVGETHYRGKGFTLDPSSWEEYEAFLDRFLNADETVAMTQEQIEDAWHYAYGFFYEYPFEFPWHMVHFEEDIVTHPMDEVVSEAGMRKYFNTFEMLAFN